MKRPSHPLGRGVYEAPYRLRDHRRYLFSVSSQGVLLADARVEDAGVDEAVARLWQDLSDRDPRLRLIA